ncbi:Spermidine/putrescine transport system permease protein PotB [Hartmannibacter diazotrophicus]|uniref:Spermidine/putrescine transport system permease protein PotB n=1 Tax=Hartmannibacter diazotrophicus TaxID=1482074 RepID=A0A2C9DAI0_9HYPH|nr:ABC transporter permease [Hartmannibacter diazotrophicus]SON56751.1 Spermidine/putrescine transport system permease protein PotB [Hartmannibacter diazotrophicus]
MASADALPDREWRLALPLAIFFLAFFIAPLLLLVSTSFETERQMTGVLGLRQYAAFFGDSLNLDVLIDTLLVGLKATLLCLVFGYPLAWLCTKVSARLQAVLIFLVVLPIVTSVVVRTFAWIVILGRRGIVNDTILALGLSSQPLRLLFAEPGVVIVLAQVQMPLMVLPLLTTLQRLDPNLEAASAALGAGAWRTFFKVTLPLSMPGIIAGFILTYTACVTAFVTQSLIGGSRLLYMPMMIFQQAMDLQNWPFAAAISVIFMISVLLIVGLAVALSRSRTARLYG